MYAPERTRALAFKSLFFLIKAVVLMVALAAPALRAANHAPVANNDSYTATQNVARVVAAPGVLANDTDSDNGTVLRAFLVASPTHGSVVLNTNGGFTYTPQANYTGSDAFTYQASDGLTNSTTATVSITVVPTPVSLVTPPQSQTNCLGGTAVFSVTANGSFLVYQWFKGTAALANQTNSTLTLPNLIASDAATYSVRVTNSVNSISNSATLTLNTPVTATSLTNFIRFVGSVAIFTTKASGTGPITFQWLKNNSPIAGQTSSNLTLTNLALADSGNYSVVVNGACGSITNSAALVVENCFPSIDAMVVIDRSGSMVGQPYTDARAACTNFVRNLQFGPTNDMCGFVVYNTNSSLRQTLTNNPQVLEQAVDAFPPPTNGTRISYGLTNALAELFSSRHRSNSLPVMVLMSDGLPNSGDSPSNVLYNAQIAKNAGVRIFTVGLGDVDLSLMAETASSTNDFFFTTNSSQLSALFDAIATIICRPPTNIVGPSDLTVCVAQTANFNVMASGCTGFTFQWRKDGVNIAGQTNNTLTLNNVQPTNAGLYSVVVSAACRTVTNSATLTVNSPAQITVPPVNTVGVVGGGVTFSATATGTALSYEWRKNGTLLSTSNTLTLNGLTTNSAGTYCVFVTGAFCGSTVSNCVTLTISNRAPIAVNDSYTINEDTPLIANPPGVLGNDSDPDGDSLTSALVTPPTHGTLTLNNDGGFTYTPDPNYDGPDSFTYRATDGSSNSNPATVSISVTPVNDAPVANNDAYSMTADTTLNIVVPGVLANDTDIENDPLSAILETNPTHGTLTLNANGSFTYQPNTNFSGSDSFTYRTSDGSALSGIATVTITVIPVPVVIIDPPINRTNCPGDTAFFSVNATGTALTYQWLFGTNVLMDQTNSTLVLPNINATNAGNYCVVVGGAAGGPLTNCAVLVVNENVIVTIPPTPQTVCENTTAQFIVGATGTALTYQWYFGATALIGQTSNTLTLSNVGLGSAGNYIVVVSGTCGTPVTNGAMLTVNQNVQVLTPPSSQTSFVGSNVTFSVGAIGTGLNYQWFFNGILVGASSTLPLSNLSTNQAGTYCVVVSGICGSPITNCTTLTIQNRAPVANNDSYSVNEDTTLTINAPGVLSNDSDIDGDTLTAVLVSNPTHGTLNFFGANGAFTYTPSLNYTGLDTFTYRASDTRLTSAIATVTITVIPVNDAPVANNDSYSVNEDTTLTILSLGVLANDFDVDGDPLSAVLVANVTHGTLSLSNNGAFVYTPSLNYTGLDIFTYRATDGSLTSGVATVTITILPVNDAPVANDDFYTINEDTILGRSAQFGILANDVDVDGNPLTVLLVSNVLHGSLGLSNNGAFVYTPSLNYTGIDTFTYRNTDGALTSGVATVTITILPVNDAPVANNDFYSVNEDTTLTIPSLGVLANDTDVDGDPLTSLLVSNVTHGTLVLNNNGAFIYTPSLNYTGADTFTYRATDGSLTSGVATVTITVVPVNDAPVAVNDFYSVNEDTTLTIAVPGVLANDSDVDGDPLTSLLVSNVTHGTLILSNNGAFTYTPSLNYTGLDTFTYRATDGSLTSGIATVTITIVPVNDVPVANNDFYSVNEDTTLTIPSLGVLANDTDVDGDPLTSVLVTSVTHGTLSLSNNGAFVYTPSLNYTGADTFTYRATDGSLTSSIATVTITVVPVNDAPVALNDSYSVNEDTTLTIPSLGVLANDIDVDGDPLTSLLVSNVTHGTLTLSNNGAFVYTPSLNYTGLDTFTYRATDGSLTSAIATVTITILPVNDAPVANDDAYTINEDTTLGRPPQFGILANDIDVDGDALTPLIVSNVMHGTLTLSNSGAFFYTPSLNYTGIDIFTYRVTDGSLTSGVATVTITILPVNDAPVANNDAYILTEDSTLTVLARGVLTNDIDVDGDILTSLLVSNVSHGTLTFSNNGAFTYTPSLNYTGIDTFLYRATDGALTSGVATVTLTILPVNDAPVAVNDFYSVNEDTPLFIPSPGVLTNDGDVDGDPLTSLLVSNVLHGTLTLSNNGAFVYTPSLNYTGVDTFRYRATDGALSSGVTTVTITVLPVNDTPVAVNDFYSVNEDSTLNIPSLGVLSNDSDVDGDPLSSLLVSNVTHGMLILSNNGAFTYTPSLNYTGVDTFTYRATDGSLTSSVATVTITVLPLNDVPVANNDAYTINEDTVLNVPVPGILANDSDVDGDPLSAVLAVNVTHGTLSLSNNGSFIYRPNTNYNGIDSFTYRATDGSLTSVLATVTITINPTNDAPLAVNDDAYTTLEDTILFVPKRGILTNDIDVDGDTLFAVLVNTTTHGTLSLSNNGAFVYRPSLNYTGLDTFTYRATDGALTSDVATVTITVLPVNDAPVANNDSYSINEDTALNIGAPGVLANDSDVDGDALTTVLVSTTTHGSLTLNPNGSFTYLPNTNYNGPDSFTYRATDGALTSGVATVTITVLPVNDPPTTGIEGDNYSVLEDHTLNVTAPGVLGNDSDVDGDPLTALLVSGPSHGTLTLNANGSFTYSPSANYFGPDSFVYVANDGAANDSTANSLPATVNITVIPVNDAPSFAAGSNQKVNINAGAQTIANWATSISAGPTNESDQTLAFIVSNDNVSLFSSPPTIAPNGTLTYTPATGVFGAANVHVTLRDNGGTANGGVDTSGEIIFRIVVNGPPTVSIISPTNGTAFLSPATFSIITDASDPDGTVTNVQFLVNNAVLGNVAQGPFYLVASNQLAGNYTLRAVTTDDNGLSTTSAVVNISVITNAVVATGPIVLNHQNGLFEQFVTVSNLTTETWANGVRLFVQNLDTTNRVYNATGTNNGVPYLDKIVSVAPGGMVMFTVQYYIPNPRSIPNPTLVAVPLPFSRTTSIPQITRIARTAVGFDLSFTTQSGRYYFVQYTEDLVHWMTAPTPLAGSGEIQIAPQSNTGGKRFFRIVLVP